MRRRGSALEILPVLLLGIVIMLGALQTALFMSGRHAAELGAYRASRVLEQKTSDEAERRRAAGREAESASRIGYPATSTTVHTSPSHSRVDVRVRMEPLFPLPFVRESTIRAQHPPKVAHDE